MPFYTLLHTSPASLVDAFFVFGQEARAVASRGFQIILRLCELYGLMASVFVLYLHKCLSRGIDTPGCVAFDKAYGR